MSNPASVREAIDLGKFRRLRRVSNLTQIEMAKILGIHRGYLGMIENGLKTPSARLVRSMKDFMAKAERENSGFVSPVEPDRGGLPPSPPVQQIPLLTWSLAHLTQNYTALRALIDDLIETQCQDASSFAIVIEGDSMEDKFQAGDQVIFAADSAPKDGDAVVARHRDGRLFFKWFRTEGKKVRLLSENPNYQPLEFLAKEFEFIYPAWEVKRTLRK